MSGTIDRNLPIPVTMTLQAGHWEAVLQVLGNAPHNVVRSLFDQIQQQCMQHARFPLPEHMPMRVPGGANGEAATIQEDTP